MNIALFICGCYWVFFSFICNTKNLASHIFFKVMPFATGFFTIFYAMKNMGWIYIR